MMHSAIDPELAMTRMRLFQIRIAATATVLLLAFIVVRFLWFPGGYFAISGITKLLLVLIAVNVVVGPGLSTLVYKPGKWGLRFDLVLIACIEVAILGWGLHEIYERRPEFAVFAVDRFEAVARSEVDISQLQDSRLATRPGYTPRLIYAELPTDPEIMNQLIDDTVFLGRKDIDRRPEFWRPYADGIATVKAAAMPLSRFLTPNDSRAGPVRRWLNRRGAQAKDYIYLPLRGREGEAIAIIHADIGYPVDVLAVDPWQPFPDET